MKQTQKLVSLVLAVAMILSCFACGVFAYGLRAIAIGDLRAIGVATGEK